MQTVSPSHTQAWKKLETLAKNWSQQSLRSWKDDVHRAQKYRIIDENLALFYGRNLLDEDVLNTLFDLAEACGLQQGIEAMFSGEKINQTENRAVLHTALRNSKRTGLVLDGTDVLAQVHEVLDQMKRFSENLRSGVHLGYTGQKITDVVNIGIGGSDLGPYMAYEALKDWSDGKIKGHYVSNVDGIHLHRCLKDLKPETTLFIIASKTFTTQETMANARAARAWFLADAGDETAIAKHFVALSTNLKAAQDFGIETHNIFGFWDWVGGRYSMWSAIGLSLCCTLGFDHFEQMLRGAEATDQHFRKAPFQQNIPVIMALIGIWYNNFLNWESHAILPYDQRLHRLPAFLQQADMESNGKTVDRNNQRVDYETGQIIWGEPGTNGQHAFYQLLHQGSKKVSCDFLASAQAEHPYDEQQEILLANFFAQPQAMMNGLTPEETASNMRLEGKSPEQIEQLLPHRVFEGNRPSNVLFYQKLDPYTFGRIIAIYEHRIFVQGWIWNVYSFDQWGVELGKKIANGILSDMKKEENFQTADAITKELIALWKKWL